MSPRTHWQPRTGQTMSREVAKTKFEGAAPILSVRDMSASVRYYVNVLGFRNADWGSDDFTSVNRDGAGIFFFPRAPGRSRREKKPPPPPCRTWRRRCPRPRFLKPTGRGQHSTP